MLFSVYGVTERNFLTLFFYRILPRWNGGTVKGQRKKTPPDQILKSTKIQNAY